jgi:hypothetical protein
MEPGQAALGKDPLVLYAGKTAVEIVVLFKDPATFPWHRLSETVCGRKFEELWLLSTVHGNPLATEAVQLLSAPEFDQPCHET